MNTDNGRIYRTQEEIEAARARGEPLAMVSDEVASYVEAGRELLQNRAARREEARARRKRGKGKFPEASDDDCARLEAACIELAEELRRRGREDDFRTTSDGKR